MTRKYYILRVHKCDNKSLKLSVSPPKILNAYMFVACSYNLEDLLLGVDIGTLGVKGVIVDLDGRVLSKALVENDIITINPDWAEQDAEKHWWQGFVKVVKAMINKGKITPNKIQAIGVGGLFPSLCPLDKHGNPLRPAILYSDNRAVDEIHYLNKRFDLHLTSEEITPKILWYKKHEPDKFSQTKMLLNANGYVVYKLTGEFSTDYLLASAFGAVFDDDKKRWKFSLCDEIGFSADILPPAFPSTRIVGTVSKAAAEETGLAENTPVIVGTGDVYSSMLGSTVINERDGLIYFGTTGLFFVLRRKLDQLFKGQYHEEVSSLARLYTYVVTTGELLAWFKREFCQNQIQTVSSQDLSVFQLLDEEANNLPAGSEGLICVPYFRGQRTPKFNPNAKGVLYGLTIYHTKTHIYRAFLESFAYAVRHGFQQASAENLTPARIVVSGGGAKSSVWRQIMSDVLNFPLEFVADEVASIGNAFLAGYGIGLYNNLEQIREWISPASVNYPNPERHSVYSKLFETYVKLHSVLYAS